MVALLTGERWEEVRLCWIEETRDSRWAIRSCAEAIWAASEVLSARKFRTYLTIIISNLRVLIESKKQFGETHVEVAAESSKTQATSALLQPAHLGLALSHFLLIR